MATDLKRSTTGHSAELHCQGVGKKKKKKENLKTSRRWVPSICFRHRSCWRTSQLPACSSPVQPGEGETQVIIRSCSHPAPRAGALPTPPQAGGRSCSHPRGVSRSPGSRRWPLAEAQCPSPGLREQEAAPPGAASSKCSGCTIPLRPVGTAARGQLAGRKAADLQPPSPTTYIRTYAYI